jgi:predicted RND superfamily exporter protein
MWQQLGQLIVRFKVVSLIILGIITLIMGYFAIQVKLSYEFTKAIPEDNPKFIIYKNFVKKFGVDGTTVVVGFQTDSMYTKNVFNAVYNLHQSLKKIQGVTDVLSLPYAYTITKDSAQTKFVPNKIFNPPYENDSILLNHKATL